MNLTQLYWKHKARWYLNISHFFMINLERSILIFVLVCKIFPLVSYWIFLTSLVFCLFFLIHLFILKEVCSGLFLFIQPGQRNLCLWLVTCHLTVDSVSLMSIWWSSMVVQLQYRVEGVLVRGCLVGICRLCSISCYEGYFCLPSCSVYSACMRSIQPGQASLLLLFLWHKGVWSVTCCFLV